MAGIPIWKQPVAWIDWPFEWAAYGLKRWAFLDVLDRLGRLAILVAVVSWLWGIPARARAEREAQETAQEQLELQRKAKMYQAWQVINTAAGKGGSGGRKQAMIDLVEEGERLDGINLAGALLTGWKPPDRRLFRANFGGANLVRADLSGAALYGADLSGANLSMANFNDANLVGADLSGADLTNADLTDAALLGADLSGAIYGSTLIMSLEEAVAWIRNLGETTQNPLPSEWTPTRVRRGALEYWALERVPDPNADAPDGDDQ